VVFELSLLDTLIETKNNVENGIELPINQRILLIDLIGEKQAEVQISEDAFRYFYSDVIATNDVFDFESVLNDLYVNAKAHAGVCVNIYSRFSNLKPNEELSIWLSSAIKTVDNIAIYYLQTVLDEELKLQGEVGWERSKYIQINRRGVRAERAGRIMDELYGERNKMEHRTKNDPTNPGQRILMTPKFGRILRKIQKRFPEALVCFNDAFKEYYGV
jgi:hypothetical protein